MKSPRLTGSRCLCRGCGEYFNSVKSFDRQRIDYPDGRRCLSSDDMHQRGMTLNRQGFWITEPMRQHHLKTSAMQPTAALAHDPVLTSGDARLRHRADSSLMSVASQEYP
jgi:hypothetical protein